MIACVNLSTVLVTHPDANHGNPGRMLECNGNQMVASSGERCQPHVDIIARFVHAIDEIGDNARIVSVLWQYVDIRWIGCDLRVRSRSVAECHVVSPTFLITTG